MFERTSSFKLEMHESERERGPDALVQNQHK